jgi:two-component system chemotaxis response regulator CheB
VLRYRCHTGHGITSEGLAQAQGERIEESLWRALRALEEHAELRRRMASRAQKGGLDALAEGWDAEADDAERRADDVRRFLKNGRPRSDTPAVPGARRAKRTSLERGGHAL